MFRWMILILLMAAAPAFAIPKYHPGIACVLSVTNANVAEASFKVKATGTSEDILAPETVSIRFEHIGDDFKIRILPHYEMNNYYPHILEFRIPEKYGNRRGGAIQQPTFRLVESGFQNGNYFETRITDGDKNNWSPEQMGYVFEYRVKMNTPLQVDSVTYIISDKQGNIVESGTWDILEELTLN